MAALVEEMFSVRQVPWHGLGTIIEDAPSSKEAIKLAGLDWKVNSMPIFDGSGIEIPHFKANTRDIDNSVLGIVSDRYKIVQNSEAFDFTDSLLDEGMTYETAGSLNNGKRIWLLGKMPEQKILDDKIDPYVCFVNVHDGTGSIKVCMTPIRVVCNNTLNFALEHAKRTWSTIHMGNLESKLAEAKSTLGLVSTYMNELDVECNRLADKKVSTDTLEAIFDAMYPIDKDNDSSRKINNINDMKAGLFNCLEAPDVTPYLGTAYGIMMAVTDFANHNQPKRNTETFAENRWGTIITGHPFVDAMYKQIAIAA